MAETRSRGVGNYQVEGKTKYKEEDIVLEECLKKKNIQQSSTSSKLKSDRQIELSPDRLRRCSKKSFETRRKSHKGNKTQNQRNQAIRLRYVGTICCYRRNRLEIFG